MTSYSLHLFDPFQATALVQRVDKIIAAGDMAGWAALHASLESVHPMPSLSFGSVSSHAQPLTRCTYYANKKPDLVAHELPDRRSITWLMRQLIEMTAYERCVGDWSKFGSDYHFHINVHVLPRHRDLAEAHQRLMDLVFAPSGSEIAELEFLRNPDSYCSVTRCSTLATFLDSQNCGRYLSTCAETFMSMPDDLWKILGNDIRRMEWFLRAAAMRPGWAIWFVCYVT